MEQPSLINCLEYCTEYFESKDNSLIRDLWFIIALQGQGILYEDLEQIYCSGQNQTDHLESSNP